MLTGPNVTQTLHYGDILIAYRIFFIRKTRRRISIHIHPDGTLRVDAPADASLQEIKQAVYRRAKWITAQLEHVNKHSSQVLPREYVSGEGLLYLGRRYLLKVRKSTDGTSGVKLHRGLLIVSSENAEPERVKSLLRTWYRTRAAEQFDRRLAHLCRELTWIRHKPGWKLVTMKKLWGSCSPKGIISLNPHLIKAPTDCIDYVLLHELCHMKHHNHGPAFYRLLRKHMPDCEAIKCRLDAMAALLLNE